MTLVLEFHEAFDLDRAFAPRRLPADSVRLRMRLIDEEYKEVRAELLKLIHSADKPFYDAIPALRALLKELADLRYVVEGTAVAFGLDIEGAFAEVHRSNMSKLGPDGKPLYRADGKVLKGEHYEDAQMCLFVPDSIEGSAEDVRS